MNNYSEQSYKRYVQYQNNRYRYKQDQITIPIAVILVGCFISEHWRIILSIALIIIAIIIVNIIRKYLNAINVHREMVAENISRNIVNKFKQEICWKLPTEIEDTIIDTITSQILDINKRNNIEDYEYHSNIHISRSISEDGTPSQFTIEDITTQICGNLSKEKQKPIDNNKTETEVHTMSKYTETGYVTKKQQRNNGRTEFNGTDHNQKLYAMECLKCGHHYYANGSDIWNRNCPKCMNGRP